MKILITGRPGIGKTTLISKVFKGLRDKGVSAGGMITYEVREKGVRTGFIVEDLKTGLKGIMASITQGPGPRVGKYIVNVAEIERVGVKAVENALADDEVIIIDEIGPMELYSNSFKTIVSKTFSSSKKVVATIHYKASQDSFCRSILSKTGVKTYVVTLENRNSLPNIILEEFNLPDAIRNPPE
ncbi:MAG: NTPase [Candidatus Brockarchaeota archaeon]|nr:NTPase [Candidatus Brockarchaeota archaeon]